MAKFDEQLSRMQYLMGYKMPVKECKTGVDYSVVAADGKRYGIIKEGTKYYVKVCDASKENLAESYEYINGITAKKENEFKSYNEATKHLELKLMSLNEAYNGNVKASTLDPKRSEKVFATLTEEARKELNRMHTIFESANTIGKNNTGNPEAPKTATFSPSIGKPFEEKADATLDKDFNKTAKDPKSQSEPYEKEIKVTDADMESDKNEKCTSDCSCDDYEDAKYVPENSVANQKPSGGKVVKVNEATVCEDDEEILGIENEVVVNPEEGDILTDDQLNDYISDDSVVDMEDDFTLDADELGFNDKVQAEPKFRRVNDEDFFNSIDGEVYNEDDMPMESKKSLKRIVEGVCDNIVKENKKMKVKEAFMSTLERIIKEEVNNLGWGNHPSFRKQSMTVPTNKEVVKTKGDKDWNDDSVKSEKPFASKIGSSAPYTEEVVSMLTDAVMKTVKECLKKK